MSKIAPSLLSANFYNLKDDIVDIVAKDRKINYTFDSKLYDGFNEIFIK